jgi:spore coat polysaccharide biosynthesis protein SpsF
MEVNVLLITQARMSSTRLPGKIFKEIKGKKLLEIHLERLKKAKLVDKILVATTDNPNDKVVSEWAEENNIAVYRGSESDVLDRFYHAALPYNPKWVVRVTSDCPLLDPKLVDNLINLARSSNVDYASNIMIEQFPDGQDVEVFTFDALQTAWRSAKLPSEREHVTPFIRNNLNDLGKKIFKAINFNAPGDFSNIRMTVDEPADFELIQQLVAEIGVDAGWQEYVNHIVNHQLNALNSGIIRNEGYLKSIENDKDTSHG